MSSYYSLYNSLTKKYKISNNMQRYLSFNGLDYWDRLTKKYIEPKTYKWMNIPITTDWNAIPNTWESLRTYPIPSIDHKPQAKDFTIIGRPIEITEEESFRVEIKLPSEPLIVEWVFEGIDGPSLEKDCGCNMEVLMRHGCQCGGL